MNVFLAPAKLNLALKITGRRSDGYHLLDSIFTFISLFDLLYIEIPPKDKLQFKSTKREINGEDNLIIQAAKALRQTTGCKKGARIFLKKMIPLGAGLGGGSSDAATALLALNHLWNLHLQRAELITLASSLGADIPFFIGAHNARVQGIGEKIRPITLPKSYYFVLYPNVTISTKTVFSSFSLLTEKNTTRIIPPLDNWPEGNDLQETTFRLYPELKQVKALLQPFGEVAMTGSGSALFIKVKDRLEGEKIQKQLGNRYPSFVVENLPCHPLFSLL